MTILTKPSSNIKKLDINNPLVDERNDYDEEKMEVTPSANVNYRQQRASAMCFIMLVTSMVAITGVTLGLLVYKQYLRTTIRHYQGFCSVPISRQYGGSLLEYNYPLKPVRWFSGPDMQVLSLDADTERSDAFVNTLLEEFNIGDSVERISVDNHGRRVNFVHDFSTNMSGIVDSRRCFVMQLDEDSTVRPDQLLAAIAAGEALDTSPRARNYRVTLDPAPIVAPAAVTDACQGKAIYRLQPYDGLVIRKRSAVADPAADYTAFSGRHVQQLHITNMDELLAHERSQ